MNKSKPILIIKSIITYVLWTIIILFFLPLCLILTYLPKKVRFHNRLYFFLTTMWNKLLLYTSFIKLEIKGINNLPRYPKQPSIIIANHSSAIDIFLIETIIRNYPHVWLSKDSYGKIPIFGRLLKRMHVLVKRNQPKHAAQSLVKVYQQAKLGPKHIIMFPEGTRFSDGNIHDFLPGFAILAKKLNQPIIPILIKNAHKVFPKKTLVIDSNIDKVKIIVGKPFFCKKDIITNDCTHQLEKWFKDTITNC